MKERPILLSGEMARAILDGRKTQTRRVVKNPGFDISSSDAGCFDFRDRRQRWNTLTEQSFIETCPYGQPGDRLWVRETFRSRRVDGLPGEVAYRADHPGEKTVPDSYGRPWKPSIHMPRWASRITLEVTAVRVERLQDISADDARAEGIQTWIDSFKDGPRYHENGQLDAYPVSAFSRLWKSINGADSWDANPWVWVVEFRVIEPSELAA